MAKKRAYDGRQLEGLVAFVEQLNLPENFDIEINKQIIGESGVIEAELDILISGKIGSAKFQWLIECRDRPSSGAAPTSWIEQLIGRRDRLQINKVTAVSTQPFSKPAIALAKLKGIDLRNVKSLSKAEFEHWLRMPSYKFNNRIAHLSDMQMLLPEGMSDNLAEAVTKQLIKFGSNDPILIKSLDRTKVYPKDAFLGAVELQGLFDAIEANNEPRLVKFGVRYANPDDCFEIETELGFARIESIIFTGELSIRELDVPLESVVEYGNVEEGKSLSHTAMYESQLIGDKHWSLALHKDLQTDETKLFMVAANPHKKSQK